MFYVSKDGLVGHHWKERPIGHADFVCPGTGEHQGQRGGVGGLVSTGRRNGVEGFQRGKQERK